MSDPQSEKQRFEFVPQILGQELSISVRRSIGVIPDAVIVNANQGRRVVFQNDCIDLDEREEIGTLVVSLRDEPFPSEVLLADGVLVTAVNLLSVDYYGSRHEVGVMLEVPDRLPIIITAGNMPSSMSIFGPNIEQKDFEPEFDIGDYIVSPL